VTAFRSREDERHIVTPQIPHITQFYQWFDAGLLAVPTIPPAKASRSLAFESKRATNRGGGRVGLRDPPSARPAIADDVVNRPRGLADSARFQTDGGETGRDETTRPVVKI
jgi:hypothetical protein